MSDTLDRLRAQGYRVEERWYTSDVMGFVRRELSRPRWPLRLAFGALGLTLAYLAYRFVTDVLAGANWFSGALVPFGCGVLAVVPIVVPHELLHGLGFKLLGAPRVVYGAEWRLLVFHASAPGHALTPRQMDAVALAPFLVLTPGLLAWALLAPGGWAYAGIGALLMHTQGCLGDFAMVNYFARTRDWGGEVLTFDEASGESFVIVRRGGRPQTAAPAPPPLGGDAGAR